MPEGQKGGKKNRKFGRASRSASMAAYRATMRWETNKKKKLIKHIKRTGNNDRQAMRALEKLC